MKHWHIAGICGIGMSALAQFARACDIEVSGSDRALENCENAALKAMLQAQGITLYPQDGSRFSSGNPPCDAVVYSTAIEESNPDFAASQGILRLHRATALKELIRNRCMAGKVSVAVAGTCGKTSTTAIISEALANAGTDPECINGGMIKAFKNDIFPGNYRRGGGAIVFEADESDKSLLEFHPDYALVLNIGTDHYPKAELAAMFAQFVNQAQCGAVLALDVWELIRDDLRKDLKIITFSGQPGRGDVAVEDYRNLDGKSMARFSCLNDFQLLASPGMHTALNTAAAIALLKLMGYGSEEALKFSLNCCGVARRFDFKGRTSAGAAVYDDYAHNPEKLATIIKAAQETAGITGRVFTFFQPHGYGPFGFMKDELGRILSRTLRPQDKFFLAEPFYAGGTSSFSPHAAEVASGWEKAYPQLPIELAGSRDELKNKLLAAVQKGDIILITGARDNTLSLFAENLCS